MWVPVVPYEKRVRGGAEAQIKNCGHNGAKRIYIRFTT